MYHLVRFDDNGQTLTVLETAPTEDTADVSLDRLNALYPSAYIDIMSNLELCHARAMAAILPQF
jgi:hypothetical protein